MKMINEIITILNDYINGREGSSFSPTNKDEIVRVSRKHGIGGLVYIQTGIKELGADYYSCIFQYYHRNRLINEITELFSNNNIAYFFVKGPVTAKSYRHPFLRTMGDVDITVHKKDMFKAMNVLVANGYSVMPNELQREYEWHFSKNGLSIELHHALLYNERVNDEEYLKFFNQCWEYVNINVLDESFHLLYVIFHMRKHFMNGGIGIRFFIDLAMLSKSTKIDWNYIENELTNLGMIDFARICYTLCKKWFNIPMYLEEIPLPESFVEITTDNILTAGIFGNRDTTGIISKTTNLMRKYNTKSRNASYIIRTVRYMLKTTFPPYKDIVKTYGFINGKPYLLPIAWICRIFNMIAHDRRRAMQELMNPFRYAHDVHDREELYKEWRL